LTRCLVYGDLNMVRCRVVKHPRDWPWCGYPELMGLKRRHRILDVPKLLELTACRDLEQFRKNYDFLVADRIAKDQMAREPFWTESLAINSRRFAESLRPGIRNRMDTTIDPEGDDGWTLNEVGPRYGLISNPKK